MRLFAISLLSGCCLLAGAAASADELRLDDAQLDSLTAGNEGPRRSFEERLQNNLGGFYNELVPVIESQIPEGTSLPPELQALVDLLGDLGGVNDNGDANGDTGGDTNGGLPPIQPVDIGNLFDAPPFGIPN